MCDRPLAEHALQVTTTPVKVGQVATQKLRSLGRREKKVRRRQTAKSTGAPVVGAGQPAHRLVELQLWPDLQVDQMTVEDGANEPAVLHDLPEHSREAYASKPLHLKELVEVINQSVPH